MSDLTFEARLLIAARALGHPVRAKIEVADEVDPDAPVVEGEIQ